MGADAPLGETSDVLAESPMAWLERHPTSGHFHLCFRWNGKRKRRSLSTDDTKAAEAIRLRFEENVAPETGRGCRSRRTVWHRPGSTGVRVQRSNHPGAAVRVDVRGHQRPRRAKTVVVKTAGWIIFSLDRRAMRTDRRAMRTVRRLARAGEPAHATPRLPSWVAPTATRVVPPVLHVGTAVAGLPGAA